MNKQANVIWFSDLSGPGKTPIEECINRDPKGLYKKALNGEINNFIGICDEAPYEEPSSPDIIIETLKLSIPEAVDHILDNLKCS